MSCPSCGAAVGEGARFCASCGHALVSRSDERRIVTVVFADLVGFTTLSETLDPEQVKNLVDRCFQRLARDVTSFGGQVDKIVGDAIIALFGAPVAHEDDAERAVRTALRLQETVAAYRAETGAPVQLRIGVNTGEVLVGALRAGGDYTAMGDVVNTAQRLQTLAEPGSVVVGPACHAATREAIAYRALGAVDVKGRDEPVDAWVAVETLLPPGRRPRRWRAPFVGRDAELGVLRHAIDAAVTRRRSQLLLLIGEAGVGKSRLATEAADRARHEHDAEVLEGRCVPYGEANVWWPIAEALRQACGLLPDATLSYAEEQCAHAVAEALPAADAPEVKRVVNGLLYLMGYEVPLREIEPQRAREEATRAVLAFLEGATASRPIVMVLSDLHWADPLILEVVATLVDRLCRQSFVLVATSRQAVTERWSVPTGRHNTVVVNLDPLDAPAAADLLDSLVDTDVPDALRSVLLDRSGGNPFFLEELVSLVGDAGQADTTGLSDIGALGDLPDTLRGLVAARLDGLDPAERGSLEDASVWGRRGPVQALEIMADEMRAIRDLEPVLAGLSDKEILEVDGDHWAFRSDLIREVAYGTLTKADRARRHHGIAAYLASSVPNCREAHERLVDMVAYHFGAAADLVVDLGPVHGVPPTVTESALDWLEEASRRAEVAQALPVADRLYSQAIRLAPTEASARRADLLLGRAAVRAERRAIAEARSDIAEAHTLASELGDEMILARTLLVQGEVERDAGDLASALATLDRAAVSYRAIGDEQGAAKAMREIGMARIFLGENDDAEVAIRQALAASKQLGDRRGEAWALQHLAWISFVEGRTTEAESRLARSAETFTELGDTGGLGWALGLLAFVRFSQGDLTEAERLGEQVLVESRQRGDRWGEGMMLLLGCSVRLWSGRTAEAVDRAQSAHALFHAIGDPYGQAQSTAALGRSLVAVGRVGEGLAMLEDGLAHARSSGRSEDVRMLTISVAGASAAIGDPDRALLALDGASGVEMGTGGLLEMSVARGLAFLQLGRVAEAVVVLAAAAEGTAESPPAAYGEGSLALAQAVAGDDQRPLELARIVDADPRSTYLDRMIANLAVLLVGIRRRDPSALDAWRTVMAEVEATGDELARALARLAEAAALDALGDPDAADRARQADAILADLGITADGWRRIIGLALDTEPASV
jgi:class 3 adenylate cyclase/tetratricopeptide (TPR) repeat protein